MSENSTPAATLPTDSRTAGGVVPWLASLLDVRHPAFVMIVGPVGAGKSTLLRALVPHLQGARVFLAYQTGPPPASPGGPEPVVSMLLLGPSDPEGPGPSVARPMETSSMLAFGPQNRTPHSGATSPLIEAGSRLVEAGGGCVVVDSWDRDSAAFLRSHAPHPEDVLEFTAPLSALAELQASIVSTPVSLLVNLTPEMAAPLLSIADTVVSLQTESYGHGRLRVLDLTKSRGHGPGQPSQLYSLDGGHFRAFEPLPYGFQPTGAPPDPDPEPGATGMWPGSAALAAAFGRLRPGGFTGITHPATFPGNLLQSITAPIALHALRTGGRVVWIPAPSIRPSQLVELLRRFLPEDWLRERFRILSASGQDVALGDLRSVILPLSREVGTDTDLRSASAPGVRPLFPEVMRFYHESREDTQNLLIGSIAGLRAAAATASITIDERTLPVVIANYSKLPRFHLVGYSGRDDPVVAHARPGMDVHCDIELRHGRPVMIGVQPETVPFVVEWRPPPLPFDLVPIR